MHRTRRTEGQAHQIADMLRDVAKSNYKIANTLRREAGDFDDNQRRMQYQ